MKIKVLEFTSSLTDGGAETLVKDYACLIDKAKFDVIVGCIYDIDGSANKKRIIDANIKTYSVFKNHSLASRTFRRLFGEWYIAFSLRNYIRKEKPDVIHIHLRQLKYFSKIRKDLKGIKLFYTCHNLPELMLGEKAPKERSAAEALLHDNKLQIIALHKQMSNEINTMFSIDNTLVVKNGVDFNKFRSIIQTKSQLREFYGLKKEAFIIGNIGRFTAQKNQCFLIEILEELANRNVDAELLLIGAGELKNKITELATQKGVEERLHILSHRTDIPQLLKTMDTFVFPSLFEGLSVTLIEAQASGLRCIVSDKINEETILSENTIVVPLTQTAKNWVDVILDETIKNSNYGEIDKFDMNKEIKYLEKLYASGNC